MGQPLQRARQPGRLRQLGGRQPGRRDRLRHRDQPRRHLGRDYATVAYNAATGAQRWARRYNGPANGDDSASTLSVSPGGADVFVTGLSRGASGSDYATVAYNAATGARRWVRVTTAPATRDGGRSLAVSPGGGTVFVTGTSRGASNLDYATVAYNAATGARRWARRYNGPANGADNASSVAVSPGGATVFVTGRSAGRHLEL